MTTWRKAIYRERVDNEDSTSSIICTLTEEQLDIEFDDGYGGTNGLPFTAWTDNYVYFPLQYNGSEWCGSVRRNPCDVSTNHQGG